MELKLSSALRHGILRHLLIVPYGIETNNLKGNQSMKKLLIVPYGIETLRVASAKRVLTGF